MKIEELIENAANRAARLTVEKLERKKKFKYNQLNSFSRTEKLLYVFYKIDDDNPIKTQINRALQSLSNDEYYGLIESIYNDKMKLRELADIYDVKYQRISYHRTRLIRLLAQELFPNEVAQEILED